LTLPGLSSSSSGIFEKFKHFSTISEEECFQITRWTKEQFNAFSKFINSVYDTVGRTKEQMIFQLKNTDLAIFVDGTYAKLEKSSNNQFQYNCWSQQKMDLLIKPFLITCADGYIIDCYGPFQANTNDATIFQYILDTDEKLMEILSLMRLM
jgi:hypothetical protein